jgi:hypothetical protein
MDLSDRVLVDRRGKPATPAFMTAPAHDGSDTALQEVHHYLAARAAACGQDVQPTAASAFRPDGTTSVVTLGRGAVALMRRRPGRPCGSRDVRPRRVPSAAPAVRALQPMPSP